MPRAYRRGGRPDDDATREIFRVRVATKIATRFATRFRGKGWFSSVRTGPAPCGNADKIGLSGIWRDVVRPGHTVSLPADVKAIKLPLRRAHAASPGYRNQTMSNPDRPFGWRKRIGLLSPTVIETAAYDFYRLAPDGVSMCATTSNIEQRVSETA